MASNNYIYKMSNAGGMSTVTRYLDMLAGNTAFTPFTPAGAYESIANITVPTGSTTASITFAGIASTYTHLQIRGMSVGTTGNQDILMYFNGVNSASNYSWHELRGSGSTVSTGSGVNTAFMYVASNSTDPTYPTASVVDILDYANTSKNKTIRSLQGKDANGSGTISLFSGQYLSTSAVTSITIYTPGAYAFNAFSNFALYGIRGN
jgi:hypothetical protein